MKSNGKKKVLRGRASGIILEDIDSKLDLIVENNQAMEKRILDQFQEFRSDIKQEVGGILMIVHHHSEKLGKHDEVLQRHEEDIGLLKGSSRH